MPLETYANFQILLSATPMSQDFKNKEMLLFTYLFIYQEMLFQEFNAQGT